METLYTTTILLLYELYFSCIGICKLSYCPHKRRTIYSCFQYNTCDKQRKQQLHATLYSHIQQQQQQQQSQRQFHCLCKHNKQQEKYHQIIPLLNTQTGVQLVVKEEITKIFQITITLLSFLATIVQRNSIHTYRYTYLHICKENKIGTGGHRF